MKKDLKMLIQGFTKNKPKILFIGPPDEITLNLKTISRDIFESQNATLFYSLENECFLSRWMSLISKLITDWCRLIVLAITNRFMEYGPRV